MKGMSEHRQPNTDNRGRTLGGKGFSRVVGWGGLVALLSAAAAARLFGAWAMRFTMDPDYGVAALTSMHIARGGDWPVFFYGQPYLGTLEPALGALFCLVFGVSEFSVCLGTALTGFFVAVIVYLWARDAGGPMAGLAALALVVIGPAGYFPYLSLPRGGYAMIALSVSCVLWLAGKIFAGDRVGKPRGVPVFFLLGLAAGAGWWTSGLVAAALAAAGLAVAVSMLLRRREFFARAAAGLGGFVLGSLPFWVWNWKHEWLTLEYYLSGQAPHSFGHNLRLLVFDRLPQLAGITESAAWVQAAAGAAIAVTLAAGAWLFVSSLRSRNWGVSAHLVVILLFLAVFVTLFSRSMFAFFHTTRYLVPLVPALAVMTGVLVARAARAIPLWLALLPVAFWLGLELPALRNVHERGCENRARHAERLAAYSELLENSGEDVVHLPFAFFWMNFASRERLTFLPLFGERYKPYFVKAELRDSMALLGNYGGVRDFVAVSGGSGEFGAMSRNFIPPPLDQVEVGPGQIEAITDCGGRDLTAALSDANFDTFWRDEPAPESASRLDVRFAKPALISGLRIFSRNYVFPGAISVEGIPPGAGTEEPVILLQSAPAPNFFWSGPRPYWHGKFWRVELRFPAHEVESLSLRFLHGRTPHLWKPAEVQFFTSCPEASSESESFPAMLALLEERGVERLYSDRWVANAVYRETGGGIRTELHRMFSIPDGAFAYVPPETNEVELGEKTAFLALARDAPVCRRAFAARDLALRETGCGPWILFDFGPDFDRERSTVFTGLYWTGYGALACGNKRWAYALVENADSEFARNGVTAVGAALLERALEWYPHWPSEALKLAGWLDILGRHGEAEKARRMAADLAAVEHEAAIEFCNKAKFLGISGLPVSAASGERIKVKYHWQCPPEFSPPRSLSVFVHFVLNDEIVFQDDHALLVGVDWEFQPIPELFVEERELDVPAGAPAGEYEIRFGLFSPSEGGRRVKFSSVLPASRKSARLPIKFEVSR